MKKIIEYFEDLFQTQKSKTRKRLYDTLSQLKSGVKIVVDLKDATSKIATVEVIGNDSLMKKLCIKINWSSGDPEYRTVDYDSYHFENFFVYHTVTPKENSASKILDDMLKEELNLDK